MLGHHGAILTLERLPSQGQQFLEIVKDWPGYAPFIATDQSRAHKLSLRISILCPDHPRPIPDN
jgi:hypothetical protein